MTSCETTILAETSGSGHSGERSARTALPRFVPARAVLALLAALTFGCRRGGPAPEVWAEVDGQPIYREQVERAFRARMATMAEAGNPAQATSLKLNILNELISNQILLDHARHAHITVSESEVNQRIAQLQSPYSPEEFQKKLAEQGLTLPALREQVRDGLTINKLLNKEINSRVETSDAEIRTYYENNKANFSLPEKQYHLADLVVTPTRDPSVRNLKKDDATTDAAAQRKIQALYARLRTGEDFATVAQDYSEDPRTAANGGDLGFVPASAFDGEPDLKRTLEALKPGELSGIIRTPSGYHILKLLSVEAAGQRDLNDPQVEAAIRRTLMSEKEQLLKAAYIEALRDRAQIRNYLAEAIVSAGGTPSEMK